MKNIYSFLFLSLFFVPASAQPRHDMRPLVTDTPYVHDPVIAQEHDTYYLFSTGRNVQLMTSNDRRTWMLRRGGALDSIPAWTHDSVPGFSNHVWAPDLLHFANRWWMAYSCSTFGRNTSAIGLVWRSTLADIGTVPWHDAGAIVCSREGRDAWNAIDPALFLDADGQPWMTWGSFWDGIQLARLDSTLHIVAGSHPQTIARRIAPADSLTVEVNPTSRFAGRNAIEAPFVLRHDGYYYLFVSHDYCCRGMKSSYKVVCGRSQHPEGPYVDRQGRLMTDGGGTLVIEGDKKDFEAAGHSAAYHFPDGDVFICHGYSTRHNGQAILIQRPISWTDDGWPEIK